MPKPIYFPFMPEQQITSHTRRLTRLERRPIPFIIVDHHKIFGDRVTTKVRARAFAWHISDDVMDAGPLDVVGFRIYVTTVGTGACTLKLKNESTGDTLVTLTIPAGEKTAYAGNTIDECANYINWVDLANRKPPVFVVETTAGGGTKGLGVYVYYGHDRRP
jgi:hypothetical protein